MWESLESSLRIAGKQFVKRLANALQVPEKDLIKEVFKQDDVKVCIHDWTDEDFMCPGWKMADDVYVPCPNVKLCGREFCRDHLVQGIAATAAAAAKCPQNELCSACEIDGDPCKDLLYYPKLFNLIGTKADCLKMADGSPVPLETFLENLKGIVGEDGVVKMVR